MLAFFRAPVKLVSRESDRLVFRLDSREYDALRAAVALRSHLTRRPRPLTGDTAIPAALREAEADLSVALVEHRQDLTTGVDALLHDPARGSAQSTNVIAVDSALRAASISRNSVAIRSLIAFAITFARSEHKRPSRTARSVSGRSNRNDTANRTRAFAAAGAMPVSCANQFAVR